MQEEIRRQQIERLVMYSLDGSKQVEALNLLTECLTYDDYISILFHELLNTQNSSASQMICVLIKQAINKGKSFDHQTALTILISKLDTLKHIGVVLLTHIFLLADQSLQKEIFQWALTHSTHPLFIDVVSTIITDCYSSLGPSFEVEISQIVRLVTPQIASTTAGNVSQIILMLKEISYSPPPDFPNLYVDLLNHLLHLLPTANVNLKLAIGKFICEAPFVVKKAPEFTDPLINACFLLITDQADDIFVTGCDLLEALISAFPEKLDPFTFKLLLPRLVLSQNEQTELLEGNCDDE
ncbi:hypothetical protein EIN_308200, partial [Entamoeba invadens IP1]